MNSTQEDRTLLASLQDLNELLDGGDPAGAPQTAKVNQAVQLLLQFHAAGLRRVLDRLDEQDGLVDALADDPLVSAMLLLHDLHPYDVTARVERALESVRPYLKQHKGNVELLGFPNESTVQLRLLGSCHGCPSSQATLKGLIEEAVLLAAPEITTLDVEAPREEEKGFVPVGSVQYNGCPLPAKGAA